MNDLGVALGTGILGYLAGWALGRLAATALRALMLAALVWLALVCLGFSLQLPSWQHLWSEVADSSRSAQPLARALWPTLFAHIPLALGLLLGLLRGIRARRR